MMSYRWRKVNEQKNAEKDNRELMERAAKLATLNENGDTIPSS